MYRFNDVDFVFGVNTKYEVSKEYWTKQHKQKRPKNIDISNKQIDVNSELSKIENHIINAFNNVATDSVNKDWLQTQIDYYYNPPQKAHTAVMPINLIEYFSFYTNYRKNELEKNLLKKINVVRHKLERFQSYRMKPILIIDVDDKFKNDFVDYCKTEKYSMSTTQRDLAEIKTVCKHARFKGLETSTELDSLSLPRIKATNIYLTFDELAKIEKIDKIKLTDSYENAKDWLIISCYTGQRFSDFMRFDVSMIRLQEIKGVSRAFIEFTQKKTGKIMTVLLHEKVIEILNRRNYSFPHAITSQNYNKYIKEVCKLAEINNLVIGSKKVETAPKSKIYRKKTTTFEKWDLVSSHIGRRSFATNFYGKIPDTYLMNVTGHSTQAMFLSYVGKSNKDIAEGMADYF